MRDLFSDSTKFLIDSDNVFLGNPLRYLGCTHPATAMDISRAYSEITRTRLAIRTEYIPHSSPFNEFSQVVITRDKAERAKVILDDPMSLEIANFLYLSGSDSQATTKRDNAICDLMSLSLTQKAGMLNEVELEHIFCRFISEFDRKSVCNHFSDFEDDLKSVDGSHTAVIECERLLVKTLVSILLDLLKDDQIDENQSLKFSARLRLFNALKSSISSTDWELRFKKELNKRLERTLERETSQLRSLMEDVENSISILPRHDYRISLKPKVVREMLPCLGKLSSNYKSIYEDYVSSLPLALNDVVAQVRNIGVGLSNEFCDYSTARQLLSVAKNLAYDSSTQAKLAKDIKDIETLQGLEEAQHEQNVEIFPASEQTKNSFVGWAVMIGVFLMLVVYGNMNSTHNNSRTKQVKQVNPFVKESNKARPSISGNQSTSNTATKKNSTNQQALGTDFQQDYMLRGLRVRIDDFRLRVDSIEKSITAFRLTFQERATKLDSLEARWERVNSILPYVSDPNLVSSYDSELDSIQSSYEQLVHNDSLARAKYQKEYDKYQIILDSANNLVDSFNNISR
jgi:hypothetical protein